MWGFKQLESGMPERDPRETEFFRLPQVSDALVREVIQNSLDARRDDQTKVKVCFTFGNVEKSEVEQYLLGLIDHLRACDLLPQEYTSSDFLRFLTIEDFGTTGLDGPTGEKGPRPEKGRSNFFDFWWREGISGKKKTRAGRWGLGKTTFHIVSKLRTFWGFTVRHDDSRRLWMGKALLKTHYIGSTGYQYCGYFTGNNYEPISDNSMIDDMRRKFAVSRGDNDPGFLLIILMPDEEISHESILKSVIIHYFHPIAKGTIEVEIKEGTNDSVTIHRNNLMDVAVSQNWSDTSWAGINIREMIQFLFDAISSSQHIKLTPSNPERPEITEAMIGAGLTDLKAQFNSGNLMTFKVLFAIRPATGVQPIPTHFMLHVRRYSDMKTSEEFWIRSGIRIIDIQTLGNRPVRAMMVAEDPPVATFLGDTETPAHTDWKENTEGFREKYQDAARILRFIKKSMSKIVSLFDEPPREIQKDFLKEIFYVPITREEDDGEEITGEPVMPPVERKIPVFITNRIQRGFNVSLNPRNQNISLPLHATVMAAYDVRRGNPFAKYQPYDFDLVNLQVYSSGCQILNRQRNRMEIEIASRDFNLQVTGFDSNRDLVVKVTEA